MKQLSQLLCLLLVAAILVGCSPEIPVTAPETSGAVVDSEEILTNAKTQAELERIHALGTSPDDNYRTWYEIFVYSFCDSNGDGIGDLKGVTSKLDYLEDLGITGIWLMPIHPSVSYHKYDVSDYYAIDPAYGTMEDFEEFMQECEKRDIHVILDLVLNHTGSEHPWFREAYQYMQSLPADAEPDYAECPYADYYFFDKSPSAAYYYEVEGSDWKYEGKFWSGMPDLNLANLALREEIRNIMDFWLSKGVAGFRLDAAKEFYSDDTPKNVEVLSFLTDTLMELKPGAFLVAEVWEGYSTVADYYESGIPSIFDFYFGDTSGKIVTALRNAGQADKIPYFAQNLQKADEAYLASNPDYIDAPFLSNHDTGRIYGFCSGDSNKMKLAGAMNLFMSGSAFVYYGEELGMPGSGNDPSKRAPMVWNEARDAGTTNPPPECELPDTYKFGSLELQEQDDTSIYNYYRLAVAIRQALPEIARGRTTVEEALNKGCVSAQRKTWESESCIILMNIQDAASEVDLSDYSEYVLIASLSATGEEINLEGGILHLAPFGVAILKK